MPGLLTLSRDDYLGIDPSEVGNPARRGYGSVEDVRIPAIEAGATSFLAAVITATATSFDVADASRFPTPPFTAQIGGEIVTVGAVTGNTFSGVARGEHDTDAAPHSKGRTVYEVRTEYVYLVSDQPIKSIGAVYVDGVKQSTGYTAFTGQAGSEHADYPGQACVAFAVDPFVGRQRNTNGTTETVGHAPTLCTDAGRGAEIAALIAHPAALNIPLVASGGRSDWWCSWPAGFGAIISDSASLLIDETASAEAIISISSVYTRTGGTIRTERVTIPADASGLEVVAKLGTEWGVQLTVCVLSGAVAIRGISRSVVRLAVPAGESTTIVTDGPLPPSAAPANSTRTWSAPAEIVISAGSTSPYPAPLVVRGHAGEVAKITVTLTGFYHSLPAWVSVEVWPPWGSDDAVMLLAQIQPAGEILAAGAVTLVFDDAGAVLPGPTDPLPSGTYQPVEGAVMGPYWAGRSPNGTWGLYVEAAGGSGKITDGWALTIETAGT